MKLFSDSGNVSMMRFCMILVVVVACVVAVLSVIKGYANAPALVGGMLLSAFGGKGIQKFAERRQ